MSDGDGEGWATLGRILWSAGRGRKSLERAVKLERIRGRPGGPGGRFTEYPVAEVLAATAKHYGPALREPGTKGGGERGANLPMCVHCGKFRRSRPRGLCWGCHENPEIRAATPKEDSKHTRRGSGADPVGAVPLAGEPTRFPPGTEGKILVMRMRAHRNQAVFHPGDARLGDPHPPREELERLRAECLALTGDELEVADE